MVGVVVAVVIFDELLIFLASLVVYCETTNDAKVHTKEICSELSPDRPDEGVRACVIPLELA
jgi:hypothetical protein